MLRNPNMRAVCASVNSLNIQQNMSKRTLKLPDQVNRILFVRNLPFKITAEELYDIFGKYGAIRQIRKYVIDMHFKILQR